MSEIDFSTMSNREKAKYMINQYMQAEIAILNGAQSYTISGKSLTRANLGEIVKQREYWEKRLSGASARKIRRVRVRSF